MLEVRNLSVAYGQHRALTGVSLNVDKGEIVVILGANGAGKSTLLRAMGGISEGTVSGEVTMEGMAISDLPPHEIVERGVALVPEGRGVFPDLTVHENLLLGAYSARARVDQQTNMDRVFGLFPKLRERRDQLVRTMSGGEQQMVAIGRAMMSSPAILMLDEPSLGLSPLLCKELFHSLSEVRKSGLGILLVEQNAKQSLAIADRGYLLENSEIIGQDSAERLAGDPAVQKAYLGVSAAAPAGPGPAAAPGDHQAAARAAAADAAETALSFISTGGLARSKTDDVIAGGIDELVQHAAALQSDYFGGARPDKPAPRRSDKPYQGPGEGLAAVLSEIERAAANARLPAAEPAKPPPPSPPKPAEPGRRKAPETFDDLPEIEVWRRQPEVKIYRKSDGKLKRTKGD